MNIIQPYSKLVHFDEDGERQEFTKRIGIGLLRKIEWNARISHRSEEAQTKDSWLRFLTSVVREHGDWSVVEHATATVDTIVDRGVTHEWVRHRLFSLTQESTRFVNYEKKMPASFITPELSTDARRAPNGEQVELSDEQLWRHAINTAESVYKQLIERGLAPQIARSVFPNALASRITTTGNLRNWRHFLIMRTTKEAHPQMRQVSIPLLAEFQEKIPLLFDDIIPLSRQVDNLKLPR
jgi:thymidylate synthase (FAD)